MFRQREMVRNGTRFETQRLPLLIFLLRVNYFRKDISFVKDSLISIYSAIIIGEDNGFDLCSTLLDSVRGMSSRVEMFYDFLEKSLHLPPVVVPLRYQLIITLHHSDKLASELISLITTFRCVNQTPSAQVTTLLQEIQRQLNLLIQSSEEILEDIDTLRRQVLSRTRQSVTAIGETHNLYN